MISSPPFLRDGSTGGLRAPSADGLSLFDVEVTEGRGLPRLNPGNSGIENDASLVGVAVDEEIGRWLVKPGNLGRGTGVSVRYGFAGPSFGGGMSRDWAQPGLGGTRVVRARKGKEKRYEEQRLF